MKSAILFGPFIGSLEWELYRFAPHVNYLSKETSKHKIIVLTRQERFDLYGQYANILVPLRIGSKDIEEYQERYSLKTIDPKVYKSIGLFFYNKYKSRYKISHHIYPTIENSMHLLKWQNLRHQMNYNFKPRNKNVELVKNINKDVFLDLSNVDSDEKKMYIFNILDNFDYSFIDSDEVDKKVDVEVDSSKLGCTICLIKKCKFVIGNIESPISHLAILLKKPLISFGSKLTDDEIHLLNPLKTRIIQTNNLKRRKLYEDIIRK